MKSNSNYSFIFYVIFILAIVLSFFSLHIVYSVYKNTLNTIAGYSTQQSTISLSIESGVVTTGGGGGGGATALSGTPDFESSEETFNLQIVSGESDTKEVIIKNTGKILLTIKVSATGLEKYLAFNTDTLVLKSGESMPLTFTVTAPEPGVYAGKIILKDGSLIKEVLILLNVVSEGVLFDVTLTVPELYRTLRAGQRLPVLFELTEVGAETGVDVTMKYIIKDFDGNTFYIDSETFYVLGTKSYSKKFSTAGLAPGDYVLGVEMTYPGGVATSSSHFRVSETVLTLQTWIALGALFVAIFVVVLSIIFYKRYKSQVTIIKKSRRNNKI